MKFITFGLTVLVVLGIELTSENWEEKTEGKSIFVKFFVPYCDFCNSMQPAWEQLTKTLEDSPNLLFGEVDCEGTGEDLCEYFGVSFYPTLKYGDPNNLEKYSGMMGYDSLLEFTWENVAQVCGPTNLDLCDEDQKVKIDTMEKQGIKSLEAKFAQLEDNIQSKEANFDADVEKLYEEYMEGYDKLLAVKEENIKVFKEKNDFTLMKMVLAKLQASLEGHTEL